MEKTDTVQSLFDQLKGKVSLRGDSNKKLKTSSEPVSPAAPAVAAPPAGDRMDVSPQPTPHNGLPVKPAALARVAQDDNAMATSEDEHSPPAVAVPTAPMDEDLEDEVRPCAKLMPWMVRGMPALINGLHSMDGRDPRAAACSREPGSSACTKCTTASSAACSMAANPSRSSRPTIFLSPRLRPRYCRANCFAVRAKLHGVFASNFLRFPSAQEIPADQLHLDTKDRLVLVAHFHKDIYGFHSLPFYFRVKQVRQKRQPAPCLLCMAQSAKCIGWPFARANGRFAERDGGPAQAAVAKGAQRVGEGVWQV